MEKYYLSQFVGLGTSEDPFRPRVSLYGGKWSFFDLRYDKAKMEGWAISCLDIEDYSSLIQDSGILLLADDPNADLEEEKRQYLREKLGVDFLSTSLVSIRLELFLMNKIYGDGLRPAINGEYHLHLGGLSATLSEEEAIAFVSDLIDKQEAFRGSTTTVGSPASLLASLSQSLDELREVVEFGASKWLEVAAECNPTHPLVRNYVEAANALAAGHEAVRASSEVVWVMMLARDLRVLKPQLDMARLSSRLRSQNDCEPTKYELYVMAAYAQQGANILITDEGRTGECKVSWSESWVNIECKIKMEASVRPRNLKEVLDQGNYLIQELMNEKGRKVVLQITCRQDPVLEELDSLVGLVGEALDHIDSQPVHRSAGKFAIVAALGDAGVLHGDQGSGVTVPDGFEYAFTKGKVNQDMNGKPTVSDVWGIAWRTTNPQGWIRSVLGSVRQAGKQLPSDEPSIVYVQVPPGSYSMVRARIEILVPHVLGMLSSHGRLNCVILTGLGTRRTLQNQNAVVSMAYHPIYNPTARMKLPEGFQVLGDHFTRK